MDLRVEGYCILADETYSILCGRLLGTLLRITISLILISALEAGPGDPMAAPFGGNWNSESMVDAQKDKMEE
jgi:hypothetical protein